MKLKNILYLGIYFLFFHTVSCAVAESKNSVDPTSFINQAFATGWAEVESAKIALQKSNSEEVKTFAQQVIDDHTSSNKDLSNIAQKKKLKIANNTELVDKANSMMPQENANESFDESYIKSQVKIHNDTLILFNNAALSKDIEIAGFATENIPKLEHHLHFAEKILKDIENH